MAAPLPDAAKSRLSRGSSDLAVETRTGDGWFDFGSSRQADPEYGAKELWGHGLAAILAAFGLSQRALDESVRPVAVAAVSADAGFAGTARPGFGSELQRDIACWRPPARFLAPALL